MRRTWIFAGAALIASCAAPPLEEPELTFNIPTQWTAPAPRNGAPHDFGDARLESLLSEALEKNPSLQAAAARLEAALAQAHLAGADLWPQLNARLDARRQKQIFLGIELPGVDVLAPTFNTFGASLDLSWEADLWGRLRSREAAATADAQAQAADYAGARLSLLGQTSKAYFAAVESRRQLELARSTAESYQATTERIRARHSRGLRPLLDLRLSEANLAAAESTLRLREELLDRALRQLEALVGRYPSARVDIGARLPDAPPPAPAGLPSELLRRRPDLVAAERRLAAAGARLSEARAALFPRLSLTASGGTSADELKNLIDRDFLVWNLASNLLAPIFQGGRIRAGIDLSQALRDQASAAYAAAVLQAFAEVEGALASETILRARVSSAGEFARRSREAADIAQQRYLAGLIDIVTLLEAQRRAFQSESELLTVRRQQLEARINLMLALGGAFERE